MNDLCACRKPAIMEKAGRTVCANCAASLKGREYPLREPKEMSANLVEMGYFFTSRRENRFIGTSASLRIYV